MAEKINQSLQDGAEKEIYLVVDSRTKFIWTENVLDQIRLAGIQDVTFLTDQPYMHR